MSNLMAAILSLVPGAKCAIPNDNLSQIAWFDERPMPTANEINEAMVKIELQNQLIDLEISMHAYIASRGYAQSWQNYLIMIYQDPDASIERKAACKAAGDWVKSIVEGYYKDLVEKLMGGQILTAEETNWPAHFDSTDPGVSLFTLPEEKI